MSYEIVAAHGGVLAIEEAESGGTVVVIRLPT
jgi:signal transduction histidine kinase